MKLKKVKANKMVAKDNWIEDEYSNFGDNGSVLARKTKTKSKKDKILSANVKDTKKSKSKNLNITSGKGNFGGSLKALKEIDPEFYKVI